MQEERVEVGDIPARLYVPSGATGLLLLGHGGGYSKDAERFVTLSRLYAEQTGLAVVCIDAVDHGERRPTVVGLGVPPGWHSRTAPRMSADWQAVADSLSDVGPALAYVGFSMGALFGLATVAAMRSVRATVFVVGGLPHGGWTDDPAFEGVLLDAASELRHSNVLMLNKEQDELFPVEGVQQVFAALAARTKTMKFLPGAHDDWTHRLRGSGTSRRRGSSGDGREEVLESRSQRRGAVRTTRN